MPNITLLPTITSATNNTTFVVVDNRLTRRLSYADLRTRLIADIQTTNLKGDKGDPGTPGTNGVGVPTGGSPGQVLSKITSANYATNWVSLATVATSGSYLNLNDRPPPYTATSINSFIDVDTITSPPSSGNALLWDSVSSTWRPGRISTSTGLTSRVVVTASSVMSIASSATLNFQCVGFKSYMLTNVSTNFPAWVRIYTDAASRTADAARSEGNDPLPGSGVITEVITTSGGLTQLISPGVFGFNNDNPTTSTIYLSVTNKDSISRVINLSLTLLQLEV